MPQCPCRRSNRCRQVAVNLLEHLLCCDIVLYFLPASYHEAPTAPTQQEATEVVDDTFTDFFHDDGGWDDGLEAAAPAHQPVVFGQRTDVALESDGETCKYYSYFLKIGFIIFIIGRNAYMVVNRPTISNEEWGATMARMQETADEAEAPQVASIIKMEVLK